MKIHILYTLLLSGLLFSSCRVSRNIQTSSVNVDSVASHIKDSMEQVRIKEVTELNRMIQEMTSSGVTFVVDSCPERERIYALLDSAGKANYDKMRLEERLKSLSNKVTISEKGAISAEGNIKAAYFTNSKLQEEIYRNELAIDKLTQTNDSLTTELTKSVVEKSKVVEKRPGFSWYLLLIGLSAGAAIGWIAKSRLSIIKSNSMNKVTMFLFLACTMMLQSCGKFSDGTSVWAGQLWLLFWIPFLGSLYLLYRYIKPPAGKARSVGMLVFFIIVQAFCWGLVIYTNSGHWK